MNGLSRRGVLGLGVAASVMGAAPALARTGGGSAGGDRWPALRGLVERYVSEGRVPGAALAVVRPGRFRPDWILAGNDAFEGGRPVTPETLWRIYSMTKPLTGLMAMQMVADGRLGLDQPIGEVLPDYRSLKVLTDPKNGLEARAATRPITLRHLLTHTAGLAYAINGDGALEREYRRLGLQPGSSPRFLAPGDGAIPDLQTFVSRLAAVPLRSEPGTEWHYSVANDLLGGLLERVSGQPLDVLMERMLLRPLGMESSGFRARSGDRLSSNYAWVGVDGKPLDKPMLVDGPADSDWLRPPAMLAGGAGLLASAHDYARYVHAMLDNGMIDGRARLPMALVRGAMSNLMPAGVFQEKINGFGASARLTLFDTRRLVPEGAPAGVYGWGGAAGTLFQVDPVRGVGVVLMLQYLPAQRFPLARDLQVALNQDLA